jgi:hypothetical protein
MEAGRFKESLPLIRKFNRHSQLILNSINSKRQKLSPNELAQKEIIFEDLAPNIKQKPIPLIINETSLYKNEMEVDDQDVYPKNILYNEMEADNLDTNTFNIDLKSVFIIN